MVYKRKTRDRWDIEVNYGYGWDFETSEYTRAAAVDGFGIGRTRLVKHREPISEVVL